MPELADISETFEIHTNIGPVTCPSCRERLDIGGGVDGAINHVLTHIGWRLLHIGAEFDQDEDGKSVSHTVAILGKPVS